MGEERSTWGKEVARSEDGRHSTLLRDFGHGDYVVTEVTWAR